MNVGLFEEKQGHKSATRLIFVIGSFWAMAMTSLLAIHSNVGVAELIAFYTAIQGVLVGLKLGQKPLETKGHPQKPTQP